MVAQRFPNPVPVSCTVTDLYVNSRTAGAGTLGTIKLYHNGSYSGFSCSMSTLATCHASGGTVSFSPGDTYSFRLLTGQANDTTTDPRVSAKCVLN